MQKLLVICGPTATGKTALGIHLAKKSNGEIVSADSRQVYRGLDIATGKEKLENFKRQISNVKWRKVKLKYWKAENGAKIWLMDMVEPTETFSVAVYQQLASLVIDNIWQRGGLPIVVGGTGLYIKAVVDGIGTINVPPDEGLREQYRSKSAEELLEILARLSPEGAEELNPSERRNQQRLIRKIEIARFGKVVANFPPAPGIRRTGDSRHWQRGLRSEADQPMAEKSVNTNQDVLLIGLTAPYRVLRERIEKRIGGWVVEGAEDEVATLLNHGVGWNNQAMSSIGYRQWKPYFEKEATKEEVIQKWKQEEWQYAKRQLTWFKRDERIKWFDISRHRWRQQVEKLVGRWYHTGGD